MKKQTNQRRQSLLLVTIATIFLLGSSASTFAQSKAHENPWLEKSRFDFITAKANALSGMTFEQDEKDYPKPDTTEMEKWYEVVKYEYDTLAHKLYFVVKPKKASRPNEWLIHFYDVDGVEVIGENFVTGMSIFTEVGHTEKAVADTPSEKAMGTVVKKVVITRVVH
jgi:hypothetical protein